MAEQAFFPAGSESRCPVGVAVQTGQALHPLPMNHLALMALETEPRLGIKLMYYIAMTLGTLYFLHKIVRCMTSGIIDKRGIGISLIPFPMAFYTIFPGHDGLTMPGRHALWPVENEAYKQSVLFRNGKVMTFVTIDAFVYTFGPGVISGFHQVATNTELRVVLRKIVELECYYAAACNYYQEQNCYNNFSLQGYSFSQPLQLFRHPASSLFSIVQMPRKPP